MATANRRAEDLEQSLVPQEQVQAHAAQLEAARQEADAARAMAQSAKRRAEHLAQMLHQAQQVGQSQGLVGSIFGGISAALAHGNTKQKLQQQQSDTAPAPAAPAAAPPLAHSGSSADQGPGLVRPRLLKCYDATDLKYGPSLQRQHNEGFARSALFMLAEQCRYTLSTQ